MRLASRLERWQKAGLLNEAQVAAILEHERQSTGFSWQNGLYFLAVFAIVIGILAVIAANWQQIPGSVKILVHLAINAAVGFTVLWADRQHRQRMKELCLLAWFGLNLTLLGLIGQVFHLTSNVPGAMLLCVVISSPALVMLSNNAYTLLLYVIAVLGALVANYGEHVAPTVDNSLLAMSLFFVVLPMAMAALARELARAKPELHLQLAMLAPLIAIVGASVACQFWYANEIRDEMDLADQRYIGLPALLLALICCFYPRTVVPSWIGTATNLRMLMLGTTAAIAAPYLLYGLESGVLAALSFIAYWLLLGYIGHRNNTPRLISLVILVVTIRVYIVYLEVFGSLLQTGFGLIGSGVVLLVMLRAAQLLNRNLKGGPPQVVTS